jgi:tRNA threonylcarbamoyladenosine biosynthesis protein TsaE
VRQSDRRVIRIGSPEATRALGAQLGRALRGLDQDQSVFIALSGDLGAGKTTLVGGALSSLGHPDHARSPTYALIEPYWLAGRDVLHCDLYRLRHPDELDDLGLRDLAGPGAVLIVEWPERAEGRLGEPDLALHLTYDGDGRACEIEAPSSTGQVLASQLSGQT